jgi:hypothetical protein
MSRQVKGTILQAKATIYEPVQRTGQSSATSSLRTPQQEENCEVPHLILGPLHLDLLGLIVDLNKIALDLWAIPGTTLGDLFCSLVGGPPAPAPAP